MPFGSSPTPANPSDLRSFMSLVNQLSKFIPDIAAAARPLRPLMSPKRAFTWTSDHDEAFRRVKTAFLQPPVLAHFDPALPVILQTDASRLYGLGYAFLQDHGQGRIRRLSAVHASLLMSRSVTPSLNTVLYSPTGNSVDGKLVLYGQRIVVPTAHHHSTLARLHDSHRGVAVTKHRVKQDCLLVWHRC